MIRKLSRYVKEYKWYAILTPIVMIGENGPYVAVRRETWEDLLSYDM